ncbi:MAG TPA: hypothetical protein VF784_03070, partial [Anaerolineales bacterium]
DLILDEPLAAAMLRRLGALDLLKPIHPALFYDRESGRRMAATAPEPSISVPRWAKHELRWLLWLMGLTQSEIESVNRRLHFGGGLYRALLSSSELLRELAGIAGSVPSKWVERLDPLPLVAVYAVYLASPAGAVRAALERYLAEWRHVRSAVTGHDLKRLGIEPGAAYKRILTELRRARLDGRVRTDGQEQEYLQKLVSGEKETNDQRPLLED